MLPTLFLLSVLAAMEAGTTYQAEASYAAILNTTTSQVDGKVLQSEHSEVGWYSLQSSMSHVRGRLILVTSSGTNFSDACNPLVNVPHYAWIALIQRGNCNFETKINNAMFQSNASAVVIYDNKDHKRLVKMKTNTPKVVSIFVSNTCGLRLAHLLQIGLIINASIIQDHYFTCDIFLINLYNICRVYALFIGRRIQDKQYRGSLSASSTMFIAASFIVLMALLLAWVVYHYMPRLQYNYQQQRIQKNMQAEIKVIIAKIDRITLTESSEEVKEGFDPCIICFENFSIDEEIKILPCRHRYHSQCIDPWIMRDASCPMCKLDIFEYFQTKGNMSFPTTLILRILSRFSLQRRRSSSRHERDRLHLDILSREETWTPSSPGEPTTDNNNASPQHTDPPPTIHQTFIA